MAQVFLEKTLYISLIFDMIKPIVASAQNIMKGDYLNMNSIRNKFSSLQELISNYIGVLVIEETKLDETFPEGCLDIPGYKKTFQEGSCHSREKDNVFYKRRHTLS